MAVALQQNGLIFIVAFRFMAGIGPISDVKLISAQPWFGSLVESDCHREVRLNPTECEVSEDSSGEAELEVEPETSDPEDFRDLHPGALLYKASKARNLPVMAEALAHGADVNCANDEDEGKTPLMQAVVGVRRSSVLVLGRIHTES